VQRQHKKRWKTKHFKFDENVVCDITETGAVNHFAGGNTTRITPT
jgi:hypothetical protein